MLNVFRVILYDIISWAYIDQAWNCKHHSYFFILQYLQNMKVLKCYKIFCERMVLFFELTLKKINNHAILQSVREVIDRLNWNSSYNLLLISTIKYICLRNIYELHIFFNATKFEIRILKYKNKTITKATEAINPRFPLVYLPLRKIYS